jgi:copper chaperone CopZ
MTDTVEFTVVGEDKIHCEGCEQRIGKALKRLPGVEGVEASAESQRVVATIDTDQVGADEVRDRLEFLGYEVKPGGGAA